MHLMRDILDKQLVDRKQTKIGKVDGIVAELCRNAPPKIIFVELGSVALARRLGPRIHASVVSLVGWLGGARRRKAHRIPWQKVRNIGVDVEFDIDVRETAIFDWQDWLREHVIRHIPGA
jgi:hypothetical protein